jgi:hypothetical protein
MDDVTGKWRKLHNEELHNEELHDLYFSPNIVRVIKSRRMRWAEHESRLGGWKKCVQGWGNLRERDYLEDPGLDGKIILCRIFRKWDVGVWTGLTWLTIETCGGPL